MSARSRTGFASLGFEAVHGPSIDIAQDDSAALWCVTVRRLGLLDVLFDIGERIQAGAGGLPAQYSYQARFCDRATGMAWQYRLDFHETARARATACEEDATPKPPEDCVSWLNRVLS